MYVTDSHQSPTLRKEHLVQFSKKRHLSAASIWTFLHVQEHKRQAGDKAGGFAWNAESNLRSVSFVYSCVYLHDGIGSTLVSGHGAEREREREERERPESRLGGTMIHKQTIRLHLSNYVKYTAEIPTDCEQSFKTGTHIHTRTQHCK